MTEVRQCHGTDVHGERNPGKGNCRQVKIFDRCGQMKDFGFFSRQPDEINAMVAACLHKGTVFRLYIFGHIARQCHGRLQHHLLCIGILCCGVRWLYGNFQSKGTGFSGQLLRINRLPVQRVAQLNFPGKCFTFRLSLIEERCIAGRNGIVPVGKTFHTTLCRNLADGRIITIILDGFGGGIKAIYDINAFDIAIIL